MANKFTKPLFFPSESTPGDDIVIGKGTGQGTLDEINFEDWVKIYNLDLNGDGEFGTLLDFAMWWEQNGFDTEEFWMYNEDGIGWDDAMRPNP